MNHPITASFDYIDPNDYPEACIATIISTVPMFNVIVPWFTRKRFLMKEDYDLFSHSNTFHLCPRVSIRRDITLQYTKTLLAKLPQLKNFTLSRDSTSLDGIADVLLKMPTLESFEFNDNPNLAASDYVKMFDHPNLSVRKFAASQFSYRTFFNGFNQMPDREFGRRAYEAGIVTRLKNYCQRDAQRTNDTAKTFFRQMEGLLYAIPQMTMEDLDWYVEYVVWGLKSDCAGVNTHSTLDLNLLALINAIQLARENPSRAMRLAKDYPEFIEEVYKHIGQLHDTLPEALVASDTVRRLRAFQAIYSLLGEFDVRTAIENPYMVDVLDCDRMARCLMAIRPERFNETREWAVSVICSVMRARMELATENPAYLNRNPSAIAEEDRLDPNYYNRDQQQQDQQQQHNENSDQTLLEQERAREEKISVMSKTVATLLIRTLNDPTLSANTFKFLIGFFDDIVIASHQVPNMRGVPPARKDSCEVRRLRWKKVFLPLEKNNLVSCFLRVINRQEPPPEPARPTHNHNVVLYARGMTTLILVRMYRLHLYFDKMIETTAPPTNAAAAAAALATSTRGGGDARPSNWMDDHTETDDLRRKRFNTFINDITSFSGGLERFACVYADFMRVLTQVTSNLFLVTEDDYLHLAQEIGPRAVELVSHFRQKYGVAQLERLRANNARNMTAAAATAAATELKAAENRANPATAANIAAAAEVKQLCENDSDLCTYVINFAATTVGLDESRDKEMQEAIRRKTGARKVVLDDRGRPEAVGSSSDDDDEEYPDGFDSCVMRASRIRNIMTRRVVDEEKKTLMDVPFFEDNDKAEDQEEITFVDPDDDEDAEEEEEEGESDETEEGEGDEDDEDEVDEEDRMVPLSEILSGKYLSDKEKKEMSKNKSKKQKQQSKTEPDQQPASSKRRTRGGDIVGKTEKSSTVKREVSTRRAASASEKRTASVRGDAKKKKESTATTTKTTTTAKRSAATNNKKTPKQSPATSPKKSTAKKPTTPTAAKKKKDVASKKAQAKKKESKKASPKKKAVKKTDDANKKNKTTPTKKVKSSKSKTPTKKKSIDSKKKKPSKK